MFTSYRHPENSSPAYVIHNAFDSDDCYTIIERYKNNTRKATHVTKEGGLVGGINSLSLIHI